MINNEKNIDIIVSALKAHNIRHIVISPGGTNICFVRKVQKDSFFKCYSVVDERSAMYVAIGIYLQTEEIVATSCTSAQATRNYIPGLTEAYYKRVPILALTMEKHTRFKYQEYMQAPDQTSLPKDCVKASYELPAIADENDILFSNRLVNEAILELNHNGYGPVQLCIPWLDFQLSRNDINYRYIKRYEYNTEWDVVLSNKKVLMVVGEQLPFNAKEQELFDEFCTNYNVVVYCNHLSNCHGKFVVNANLALSTIKLSEFLRYKPDIVIALGGQTGDYPLYKIISKNELIDVEVWRVNRDGAIIDTYDKLTKVAVSNSEFFMKMNELCFARSTHDYFELWSCLISSKKRDIEVPFSNIYTAQKMSKVIPNNSILQLSILNSLRTWSLYEIDKSVECYSNVGAFGIDGGMSTLIGQSLATDKMCFMIIGDLAFLYDMNSISIRGIKNNVRILLVNNNGGIEFKMDSMNDYEFIDKYIAAGDHFKNAEGWANVCGFKYMRAGTKQEFDSKITEFVSASEKPIIFEIFVSDVDEAKAYKTIIDTNTSYNFEEKAAMGKQALKNGLKKMIGK